MRAGDAVAVFDGNGNEALATVKSVSAGHVTVRIGEPMTPAIEPRVSMTLAQALLKSDKMDAVIRDAVMLGVTAIQPFVSQRTDIPRAALEGAGRQARWRRTVIASVKQCGRAVVPPVLPTVAFRSLLGARTDQRRVMFVEPGGQAHVSGLSGVDVRPPSEAMVFVGPEGGWEKQEIADAIAAGVQIASLGNLVLRADAAGTVAITLLRYIWGDL
jgi:16S rRNA (uracil1498-N3)-methyltransferase